MIKTMASNKKYIYNNTAADCKESTGSGKQTSREGRYHFRKMKLWYVGGDDDVTD